ncbi:hypothetical protein AB0M45_33820 [Nocardia sp. NPDC051787]|uniref:hypothetical protein n=1 Tax=Nocardia sp. NPDC051787 TaxID=3155415 RepID=UPI003428E2F8
MRHTITILTAIAIGAAALSGCGKDSSPSADREAASPASNDSSSTSAYCAAVKDLGDIGTQLNSDELNLKAREVAAVAPAEIQADWENFADAQEAVLDAGNTDLDPTDPSALQELQQRAATAQENSDKLNRAVPKIMDHITKTCEK